MIDRLNTSALLHRIATRLILLLTKVFSKTGVLTENIEINSRPYRISSKYEIIKIHINPGLALCHNALKLDLSEYANQIGGLVIRWDL